MPTGSVSAILHVIMKEFAIVDSGLHKAIHLPMSFRDDLLASWTSAGAPLLPYMPSSRTSIQPNEDRADEPSI